MKQIKENDRKRHELIDLFWECTLTCNAKCKHCGSSAEKRKYDGEPLVRADLCDVMEYATTELAFHWGMTTNGILLNDENIAKLRKANMETISISIDGLEETHDKFRGVPGSYKTIVSNIEKLRNSNFVEHIQVTTVFHKENINQIEELYEIMNGLKIDSWRLASIDPIGRANENVDLQLDGKEIRKILDFIKNHKKRGKLKLEYGCPGFLGMEYEKEVLLLSCF